MNPIQPPQKTGIGAPQQGANVESAKQQIIQAIRESGIDPGVVIRIGEMAEKAIPNKQMHPEVMQLAIRSGLADAEDFQGMAVYQTLGSLAAIGTVIKQAGGGPK